eukprot:3216799-Rhodomonas_salina.6
MASLLRLCSAGPPLGPVLPESRDGTIWGDKLLWPDPDAKHISALIPSADGPIPVPTEHVEHMATDSLHTLLTTPPHHATSPPNIHTT